MMRSMYSAVSGLKTHQTRMDVIGNNIANVNTVAFKSSSVTFSDILYQTTSNASGANATTGTGGVNAKNVNDYLGYDQIFAVGGTWMCKSDVIKAGDWAKITAQSKEAVDTMLGLKLMHVGINTENEEEAMKMANLIGSLLNMKVAPGNSSIFVGNKEFEIMKKPGRGTNGHIAIGCNNVDRAIYHLSQRGVKFDLDSKVVKNGKTIACYFADEIAGFAFHLVQA